jgi:hypothetical protein
MGGWGMFSHGFERLFFQGCQGIPLEVVEVTWGEPDSGSRVTSAVMNVASRS